MDQDKIIKPKFADKYKDVEARREYQRKYQLERYHKKQALKKISKDEPMEAQTPKQMNEQTATQDAPIDPVNQVLGAITEALGPEDGVAKFIKKVTPLLPLAKSFVEGFVQNMNAHKAANDPSAKQQQQGPTPPDGWLQIGSMQKLNKKYLGNGNINPWYAAGELYDKQAALQGVGANVQNASPVPLAKTIHGSMEARQGNIEAAQAATEQKTMRDLERQSQQWDQKPADMSNAPQVERKDGAPTNIDEAMAKKAEEKDPVDGEMSGDQAKQALNELAPILQEDAKKYLDMVVGYFKTRDLKQFEDDLNNVDKMLEQYKPILNLLPFQAKETFKTISGEELENMIKENDPKKHEMIIEKGLKQELFQLWDELKAKF